MKGDQPARGLALIGALAVVAVATALGYEIIARHALSVSQSRQTLDGAQARQYALGGEEHARQLLHADWEDEDTRLKDTAFEPWAGQNARDDEDARTDVDADEYGEALTDAYDEAIADREGEDVAQAAVVSAFEIDGGSLEIRIEDLRGRFNLNAVAGEQSAQEVARLRRLFAEFGIEPRAADAWRDWVDADHEITGFGAEDADYLLRDPPLRSANQRAYHLSELAVAASLPTEQIAMLRPHVAVLPILDQRINVNTATPEVLGALAPNFAVGEARLFTGQVRDYDSVEQVVADYAPLGASVEALDVRSDFFRVQVRVVLGDTQVELTSELHRDFDTGALTLLSRNFGEPFEAYLAVDPDAEDEDDADDARWHSNDEADAL